MIFSSPCSRSKSSILTGGLDHLTPDTKCDYGLKTAIKEQLQEILGPCSCLTNDPINFVDLSIIDAISFDEVAREARIDILLISQRCMYVIDITDEIKDRVESISGIETAEVHQVTSGNV